MTSVSDLTREFRRRGSTRETQNRLKIILGKDNFEIIVPKALICSKSVYFRNTCRTQEATQSQRSSKTDHEFPGSTAVSGNRKSGHWQYNLTKYTSNPPPPTTPTTSTTIHLPHLSPQIFSIFLAWSVTGSLSEAAHFIPTPTPTKTLTFTQSLQLLDLYLLGIFLISEEFKNSIMDELIQNQKILLFEFHASFLIAPVIDKIYEGTEKGSLLRRFIVDVTVNCVPKDLELLIPEEGGRVEYVRDCFRAYQGVVGGKKGEGGMPWEREGCEYHEHEDRPVGYKCRE